MTNERISLVCSQWRWKTENYKHNIKQQQNMIKSDVSGHVTAVNSSTNEPSKDTTFIMSLIKDVLKETAH